MATPAMAQDKAADLKLSIWLPPAHSLVPATKEWADSIETAIFPSEQLGKAFDRYDKARDAWYCNPGGTEMRGTHFCFAFIHDPATCHGSKKVVVPEDLEGTKVRPAHSTICQLVTLMGGTNVQASAPEARPRPCSRSTAR